MSNNAIEINGQWFVPQSGRQPRSGNNAPVNRGRRKPTSRSQAWAQGNRSQPPDRMLFGAMRSALPSWISTPGEQWHEVEGFSFPASWPTGSVACATMRSELGKIRPLHDSTKVYSVMYGFTCKSDGYAGFVEGFDPTNPTGPIAPNRVRVKAGKYAARQLRCPPGTTIADLKTSWSFVWQFDTAPATATVNQVTVVGFWVSTTPLPGVKPPENFLVCEE